MGRVWFPLALLGFALLAMVGYSLGFEGWFAYTPLDRAAGYQFLDGGLHGLGSGGVGGTGWYSTNAVAVAQQSGWSPVWRWGPGIHAGGTSWLVVNVAVYLGVVIGYAVRDRRLRRGRLAALVLGGPVAIALLDLTVLWELRVGGDVRGPLVATAGLLVLAWVERSRLVLLAALLFALVELVLLGGTAGAVLSAAILFAGAFAALLRRRPEPPGDTA